MNTPGWSPPFPRALPSLHSLCHLYSRNPQSAVHRPPSSVRNPQSAIRSFATRNPYKAVQQREQWEGGGGSVGRWHMEGWLLVETRPNRCFHYYNAGKYKQRWKLLPQYWKCGVFGLDWRAAVRRLQSSSMYKWLYKCSLYVFVCVCVPDMPPYKLSNKRWQQKQSAAD